MSVSKCPPSEKVTWLLCIIVLALFGVFWSSLDVGLRNPKWINNLYGYFNGTPADDQDMVEYVRHAKLVPQSNESYNLDNPIAFDTSGYGRAVILDNLLHNMTGGFFVEVGALDGERMSNTLHFEHFFNWTGLLIEANPTLFQKLLKKHRKAYSIHAGLSLHPVAELVGFTSADVLGRITNGNGEKIQCFPLYTLMLALGRSRIDFFSLDIEGDELKVLETIPWDKMDIGLIEVEVGHVPEGREVVRAYMESVGFTFVQDANLDSIFINERLIKYDKPQP